jgi:hypothetical protein
MNIQGLHLNSGLPRYYFRQCHWFNRLHYGIQKLIVGATYENIGTRKTETQKVLSNKNYKHMMMPMYVAICGVLWFGETFKFIHPVKKSKAIPVKSLGGLWSCEKLRIPHCLDNRFTVKCKTLATCSRTYSPVRTSQEAHSVSIR